MKWEMVRLDDCTECLDNKRIPIKAEDRQEGLYPYYGANGIQGFINNYIFDEELLLLAEDGGYFGSKTKPIAYLVSGKCWVNNHAHVLKVKKNTNLKYLHKVLMFYDVSKLINGTTRKKLNRSAMEKIEIPLPPLHIQEKIAAILDKASLIIDKRKKQIQELNELSQCVFIKMFGDPVKNPMGWEIKSIKEISTYLSRGKSPKYSETEIGGFVINQKCIYWDKIIEENFKLFDIESSKYNDVYYVQSGDVLINSTGTGTLGRANIVLKPYKSTVVDSHVTLLRVNRLFCDPFYLKNILQYQPIQDRIYKNFVNGSTNQIELSLQKFSNMKIIVPPISLQQKFASIIERVEDYKSHLSSSLLELEENYKSLMQRTLQVQI